MIPVGALAFWRTRLTAFKVAYTEMERFGEQYLEFDDPHGLHLELVEREAGERNEWTFSGVTPEVAIKGFGGATLLSTHPEQTAELLEKVMGLTFVGQEGDVARYRSAADLGNVVELKVTAVPRGEMGVGTVHHIAWRAKDDQDQLEWQEVVHDNGYGVTPVQDRNYFNAIYFREHGEILFEIATDPPGFAHDETPETMGSSLMLPAQYEPHRAQIEQVLLPVTVRELN